MALDKKFVKETCKLGEGKETCRYLSVGATGYECQKLTGMGSMLNRRAEEGKMTAQGDNCDGVQEE